MPILTSDTDIRELLLTARTIAVVGISPRPERDSNRVARYLVEHGYTVIPVNPGVDEVLGAKSYGSLQEIPSRVDIVDIFRRSEFVPDIARSAIAIGARAVWMQFDTANMQAAREADRSGLMVVVDRCIMVEHHRLVP